MAKIKRTEAENELFDIKDCSNSRLKNLLNLNNQFSKETSKLDLEKFEEMVANSFCAIAIAPEVGFILAFDENSNYNGAHFQYFKTKYENFLYIDRVIVGRNFQGQGIGTSFYEIILEIAEEEGKDLLVCEVNIDPPNDISIEFHENFGFEAIEEKTLDNGKTVRYYSYEV